MDIKVKQIFEGWANYLKDRFDALDPNIKQVSEIRLKLCDVCPMRTGHACDPNKTGVHIITGQQVKGCGCHVAAKSMATDAKCPLGKW